LIGRIEDNLDADHFNPAANTTPMLTFISPFSKSRTNRGAAEASVRRLASRKEFRQLLSCERALADRNQRNLSVISFQLDASHCEATVQTLTDQLDYSNCDFDRVGWISHNRIAIILPATSGESATSVAQTIAKACSGLAREVRWQVETYPRSGRLSARSENLNGARLAQLAATNGGAVVPSVRTDSPAATPAERSASVSACPLWKRSTDLVGALFALLVLSPLMLAIALWIKCVSRGPIFFCQKRTGLAGQSFIIWKFRTLEVHCAADRHESYIAGLMQSNSPLVKRDHELPVIRGGSILRKFGVDELPQLINVLLGEMSLVGPRPDVLPFEQYRNWQRRRFDVLPGITGLWQVSGKNNTTFTRMMKLDILYVHRRSAWLDLVILLKTIPAVLRS
jgi:lipopolysaccharide/colanic/teichoic acid biosynthesis glycosyltransferase